MGAPCVGQLVGAAVDAGATTVVVGLGGSGTNDGGAGLLHALGATADGRLDATILRPGRLTNDPGTGRVVLAPPPVEYGDVTRDDTAATVAALLTAPQSAGLTLELRGGDTELGDAVAALG